MNADAVRTENSGGGGTDDGERRGRPTETSSQLVGFGRPVHAGMGHWLVDVHEQERDQG